MLPSGWWQLLLVAVLPCLRPVCHWRTWSFLKLRRELHLDSRPGGPFLTFLRSLGNNMSPVIFDGFSHSGEATSRRRRIKTVWRTCAPIKMRL